MKNKIVLGDSNQFISLYKPILHYFIKSNQLKLVTPNQQPNKDKKKIVKDHDELELTSLLSFPPPLSSSTKNQNKSRPLNSNDQFFLSHIPISLSQMILPLSSNNQNFPSTPPSHSNQFYKSIQSIQKEVQRRVYKTSKTQV